MKIEQKAIAGSLESCDCLIVVSPDESLQIHLESSVKQRFGNHIRSLVETILKELNVDKGSVSITDQGALDYCIRARLTTAVKRGSVC